MRCQGSVSLRGGFLTFLCSLLSLFLGLLPALATWITFQNQVFIVPSFFSV